MARPSTPEAEARILDAAAALIRADGDFAIDTVAEEAGVSRGVLYSRFGGRNGILAALAKTRDIAPAPDASARNRILDAAGELLFEQGFHAVTVEDIAERAGGSVATVYRHFEDKGELLRAWADERSPRRLVRELAGQGKGPGPVCKTRRELRTRLTELVTSLVAFMEDYGGIFTSALALDPEARDALSTMRTRAGSSRLALGQWLRDQPLPKHLVELDPEDLGTALFGLVLTFGYTAPTLAGTCDDSPADRAETIVTIFLGGGRG